MHQKTLLFFILLNPAYVLSLHYAGFSGSEVTVSLLVNGDETDQFLKMLKMVRKLDDKGDLSQIAELPDYL